METKNTAAHPTYNAAQHSHITLCQRVKFDSKNRIIVPRDIAASVKASPDREVYMCHEENTDTITIIIKK